MFYTLCYHTFYSQQQLVLSEQNLKLQNAQLENTKKEIIGGRQSRRIPRGHEE